MQDPSAKDVTVRAVTVKAAPAPAQALAQAPAPTQQQSPTTGKFIVHVANTTSPHQQMPYQQQFAPQQQQFAPQQQMPQQQQFAPQQQQFAPQQQMPYQQQFAPQQQQFAPQQQQFAPQQQQFAPQQQMLTQQQIAANQVVPQQQIQYQQPNVIQNSAGNVIKAPFGTVPKRGRCPACKKDITTLTNSTCTCGILAWIIFAVVAIFTLFLLAPVVFLLPCINDVKHTCPECGTLIGVQSRWKEMTG